MNLKRKKHNNTEEVVFAVQDSDHPEDFPPPEPQKPKKRKKRLGKRHLFLFTIGLTLAARHFGLQWYDGYQNNQKFPIEIKSEVGKIAFDLKAVKNNAKKVYKLMEKKEENKLYAVEQGLEISSGYKLLKIGFTPDQKPSEYSFADSTAAASNLEKMSMEFNKNEAIFTVYRENNSEKSISIGMMNVVGVNEHSEIADHKLDDVVEGYVVVLSNPNLSLETSRAPLNEFEYETVKNDLYKLNQALETVIAQLDQKKEKKFGIF